jgi:hypothetical protein
MSCLAAALLTLFISLCSGREIAAQGVSYGVDQMQVENTREALAVCSKGVAHLEGLSTVVRELAEMEIEAQNLFLRLASFNVVKN